MLTRKLANLKQSLFTKGHLSFYSSHNTNAFTGSKTHFGFRQIPEEEKETLVGQVFSRVAGKYDQMNDAMSLGIHRCWKDTFVSRINPQSDTQLLDVAGGTGDISFRFLKQASTAPYINQEQAFKATVVDINPKMLDVGINRAYKELDPALRNRIDWQVGNAENLSAISEASMDIYAIAFGIRNCTHIDAVLREAYRVLKPGGIFYCLEFSQVHPLLSPLYDFWSFQVIPRLGQFISNDRESYQYFVESIRRFPNQEEFKSMIQCEGFRQAHYENLSGGICSIHSAIKL